MKQLEVHIMGLAYMLGCPDGSESLMLEAVQKVDTAMCRIRDAGKIRARDRIAVLAALNVAYDLLEREQLAAREAAQAAAASAEETESTTLSDSDPTSEAPATHPRLQHLLGEMETVLGAPPTEPAAEALPSSSGTD